MNAKVIFYSFSPHFHHTRHVPNLFSSPLRRCHPAAQERSGSQLRCRILDSLDHQGRQVLSRVWARNPGVKSEPYEVSDLPSSVNFEESTSLDNTDSVEVSGVPWWEEFPKRWIIVVLCFWAFLLCNMDRENMSIAILPMSAKYGWNSTTVGLIQSSFCCIKYV